MQRIIEPLQMMGAGILSEDGRAPLTIHGVNPLKPIDYELLVASAQVKSGLLLAGLNANGRTQVVEKQPTRDHTERMLRWFGVNVEIGDAVHEGEKFAAIAGPVSFEARDVDVPGDISSAAYFVAAAALLDGSSLEISNVGVNPTRTLFLEQMKLCGLDVKIEEVREESNEPLGNIRINGPSSGSLTSTSESSLTLHSALVPQLIDELPLLAVVGSQIEGGIEIRDAAELRVKESDRIATTVAGLRAMGAQVEEFEDGLRVSEPTRLRGAEIDPCGDHRIAMAFTVAALIAEGETEIQDADCVAVSFPEFFRLLDEVVER
jgi:3-phosphoshikimate 1-carboxyvinyltransferase